MPTSATAMRLATAQLARLAGATLPSLLANGAWVVADQPLRGSHPGAAGLPAGVEPKRYFLYRHQTDAGELNKHLTTYGLGALS